MSEKFSPFHDFRSVYKPRLPRALQGSVTIEPVIGHKPELDEEITRLFPVTSGLETVNLVSGTGPALVRGPLTVGVVLSGGPAPGGHNAIAGLFDALKALNPDSRLLGFLNGPIGVIQGDHIEITSELVDQYRNTGGFDMIASGRDKIESDEDVERCIRTLHFLQANALVVIGGDDSNTNAAVLAEKFEASNADIQVIGLPKTIDGDMRNDIIETSFGFDSAAKTYANLVANVARDAKSAKKYTHIIKLMGRSASHVALEVALQVHPNLTIISEEVDAKGWTLNEVVDQIVDVVVKRAEAGKDYGVIVIPEGLLESLSDFKVLLHELNLLLRDHEEILYAYSSDEDKRQYINLKLESESARVYATLPDTIQHALLKPDKHGNIPVSQIETDYLLMDLVKLRLKELRLEGKFRGTFSPLHHFFGYEGRCVAPSNFDAEYCYALGYSAVQLIANGLTGYTVFGQNMLAPTEEWQMGGVPVTSMLNMELRKGHMKPVIKKALVELEGAPFKVFAADRDNWVVEDAYRFAGPIQYYGPEELVDARTLTLQLERGAVTTG